MFFLSPFDPYEVGAYAVQDVFGQETMRPTVADYALFSGELHTKPDTERAHVLLLVTPSLDHLPGTASMKGWQHVTELPAGKWRLLAGPADAWDRFGVPKPR